MYRQLYMGGGISSLNAGAPSIKYTGDIRPQGIMNAVPREGALFGGIKKAVKKVTGAVKDVVSSDLGKAALTAAAAYYAPALFGGTAGFGPGSTYRQFLGGLSPFAIPGAGPAYGGSAYGIGNAIRAGVGKMIPSSFGGKAALGITALGGLTGYLAGQGMDEQQIEEIKSRPEALKTYLRQYYVNLNPELKNQPEKVEAFVNSQLGEYSYAVGGRVKYAKGTDRDQQTMELKDVDPNLRAGPDWYIKRIEALMYEYDMDYDTAAEIAFDSDKYFELMPDGLADGGRPGYDDDEEMQQAKALSKKEGITLNQALTKMLEERFSRDRSPIGRTKKAYGNTAQMAAKIEGLPYRQNQAGVGEVDMRQTGGFIPPVGVKEKADDIPAMLSNNEFVFTADAVRGMGNGDVNKGAQRMYDMMKKLEKGGRV